MSCRKYEKLFSAYLEDDLSDRERRLFEEHLKGCNRCMEALSGFKKVVALTNSLPVIQCSLDFEESLRGRLAERESVSGLRIIFSRNVVALAGVFMLILAIAFGTYLYRADQDMGKIPHTPGRMGKIPHTPGRIEQIEDEPSQVQVEEESAPQARRYPEENVLTEFVMPGVSTASADRSEHGDFIVATAKDQPYEQRDFVLPPVIANGENPPYPWKLMGKIPHTPGRDVIQDMQNGTNRDYVIKFISVAENADEIGL